MIYPTASPYNSNKEIGKLRAVDQLFYIDNSPIGLRGVTAFNLLDKFSKGQNISKFLSSYTNCNLLRIFLYTTGTWAPNDWNIPDKKAVSDFINYAGGLGYYVKLVLHTDDAKNDARTEQIISLVSYLSQFKFPNLILAAGNEPLTHKNIDVTSLHNVLKNSGYLYSSGIYEDLTKFYGTFGDMHTPRDNEWPRKAKDTIEAYRGGGPNSPQEPPCKVPWILGEPIRPDETKSYGNTLYSVRDYYSYGAFGRLSSGGVIFHCESAKLTSIPSDFELECYNFMMVGYEKFPPDAAIGNYIHHADLEGNGSKALRVYSVGKWGVVIRPNDFTPPSNWKSMDDWSVCWEII